MRRREPSIQAACPSNGFNLFQLLLRRQARHRPRRMNAEVLSLDGVAECQHHLLCFRGEDQDTEDLSDVCPRYTQLTG